MSGGCTGDREHVQDTGMLMPVFGLLCGLARRIILQDGGHKRQVQAPSSHICTQQNTLLAAPKLQEGLRALHLQPGTHHQPPLRTVPTLLRGWQVPASFWQLLAQVNQAGSGQAARLYRGCTTALQVHRHHGSVLLMARRTWHALARSCGLHKALQLWLVQRMMCG